MPHISWSTKAITELSRIQAYFSEHSNSGGDRAVEAIRDGLMLLTKLPRLGRPSDDPLIRELSIPFRKGAFLVQYVPTPRRITITAVRHSRQVRK